MNKRGPLESEKASAQMKTTEELALKFLLREVQNDGPLRRDGICVFVLQVIIREPGVGLAVEFGDHISCRRTVLQVNRDRADRGDAQGLIRYFITESLLDGHHQSLLRGNHVGGDDSPTILRQTGQYRMGLLEGLVHGDLPDPVAIVDHGLAGDWQVKCWSMDVDTLVAQPSRWFARWKKECLSQFGSRADLVVSSLQRCYAVRILAGCSGSAWKMSAVNWSTMRRSRARPGCVA